jgi:hypothetical protein
MRPSSATERCHDRRCLTTHRNRILEHICHARRRRKSDARHWRVCEDLETEELQSSAQQVAFTLLSVPPLVNTSAVYPTGSSSGRTAVCRGKWRIAWDVDGRFHRTPADRLIMATSTSFRKCVGRKKTTHPVISPCLTPLPFKEKSGYGPCFFMEISRLTLMLDLCSMTAKSLVERGPKAFV